MKYNVHVYAVVRVKVCNIEAESQTDAIKKTEELSLPDLLNRRLTSMGRNHDGKAVFEVDHVEYAEEDTGYLVDEVGDEEYEKSKFYKADGVTPDVPKATT